MRFNWTTLWVKDMEKSLAFYQEVVGLSLKRRQMAGPVMELAFLGDGETQIELISDCTRGAVSTSRDISIGLEAGTPNQLTRLPGAACVRACCARLQPFLPAVLRGLHIQPICQGYKAS